MTFTHDPEQEALRRVVGIIGGGQLALMLAEAADQLGLSTIVLAGSATEPAALTPGRRVLLGSASNHSALSQLFSLCDYVAFESEMISPRIISDVRSALGPRAAQILPSPEVMAICADKLQQKLSLKEEGLPTPYFEAFPETSGDIQGWLAHVAKRFADGAVLKWAQGGYDGNGNFFLHDLLLQQKSAIDFIERARQKRVAVYAEELIDFAYELAALTSRRSDGAFVQYPALLTHQEKGICVDVRGPAEAFGIQSDAVERALLAARHIGDRLGIVGTYAVEFLVTHDAQVLVNEIAPRVHNSGHFSQDLAVTSQFKNHWLALLGRSLGSVAYGGGYFGMVNILGPEGVSLRSRPFALTEERCSVHWYGKAEIRPRRKLGHINIQASSKAELESAIKSVKIALNSWGQSLIQTES